VPSNHSHIKQFCARVLPVCPDGKVFIIEKDDGHGQIPGGGSEYRDHSDSRLTGLRELFEETHISVDGDDPSSRLIELRRTQKDEFHTWVCYKVYLTQEEVERYHPDVYEGGVRVGTVRRMFPQDILVEYAGRMTEAQYAVIYQHVQETSEPS
jgi:8-oxo-dGTP pyrophosphatase MutT (NUDIX family)